MVLWRPAGCSIVGNAGRGCTALTAHHAGRGIRFYQPAVRKVAEASEVAAGMTRLIAMFEKASVILRTDPTFGSTFVSSKITNIEPLISGVADANAYRACEITFTVISRALWGA